jgi:hypothetical protein
MDNEQSRAKRAAATAAIPCPASADRALLPLQASRSLGGLGSVEVVLKTSLKPQPPQLPPQGSKTTGMPVVCHRVCSREGLRANSSCLGRVCFPGDSIFNDP